MSDFKRQTAYKLKIGDLLKGNKVIDNNRLLHLDLGDRKVSRVNIVANVVERYSSAEKQYISLTLDDASGQIRLKIFGDDVNRFSSIGQGDSVMVVGLLRIYNDELYISPEIIKVQDPRYLLVRKLEFEKELPKIVDKETLLELSDKVIKMVKDSEPEGISSEKLVMELKASPELINQEIRKALEQGVLYEPRPGILRYLGF